MTDPIIVEVTIAAPIGTVWQALRDPERIRHWHGWEYDGLDDEIRAIYVDDVTVSESEYILDTGAGRFELEPRGEVTVVRVTRPAPVGKTTWDGIYDEVNEGWLAFVQQLRFYLERHPGGRRRTVVVEQPVSVPEGEIWFRGERQTGILLDDHSLVTTPHGTMVVSSYGLDADAFARLSARITG